MIYQKIVFFLQIHDALSLKICCWPIDIYLFIKCLSWPVFENIVDLRKKKVL